MKYLKYFETEAAYTTYKNGSDFVTPNVSYAVDTTKVFYNPYIPLPGAGDIVYKSNGKLNTINYEKWDSSLGTPVGILVIPEGFVPDGKARMMSLNWASSVSYMKWSNVKVDTSLTNYTGVPTTDNAGSTTTGSYEIGYLPSDRDNFTGATSYVDSTTKYINPTTSRMIPSPYLGDKPNPVYYAPISGYNNTLADFDGKGNTDVLVALGSDYIAANAARSYKAAGAEEIEWYLPTAGELGYILPRFNKIQAALTKVSSPQLVTSSRYWSSSEYSSGSVYGVSMGDGEVNYRSKSENNHVRPFAIVE